MLGGSPVPVEVAEVRRDTMTVQVGDEGRTRARDRFVIAAPVAGRLSRSRVEEGAEVSAGDVLATLSPPPADPRARSEARAAVEAAQARLERARAAETEGESAYEQALREFERRRSLLEQGALTREAVERYESASRTARLTLESARAEVRSAEADLAAARARLIDADPEASPGRTVAVRAPVRGAVLRVLEESERVVPAGTPLFEIADPGGLEVVVDLLTEEAVRVSLGDPVILTGWGGDEALDGTVRLVEPEAFTEISALGVKEQRVNVIVDLARAPESLGSGYKVDAAITVWREADVLTVPTSALFQGSGGWRVFVVEAGRARLREVQVGRRGAQRAQVLSGLEGGELVITFPSNLVSQGVRVEVREP
jgi:HlyD family secretion protein